VPQFGTCADRPLPFRSRRSSRGGRRPHNLVLRRPRRDVRPGDDGAGSVPRFVTPTWGSQTRRARRPPRRPGRWALPPGAGALADENIQVAEADACNGMCGGDIGSPATGPRTPGGEDPGIRRALLTFTRLPPVAPSTRRSAGGTTPFPPRCHLPPDGPRQVRGRVRPVVLVGAYAHRPAAVTRGKTRHSCVLRRGDRLRPGASFAGGTEAWVLRQTAEPHWVLQADVAGTEPS